MHDNLSVEYVLIDINFNWVLCFPKFHKTRKSPSVAAVFKNVKPSYGNTPGNVLKDMIGQL